MLKTLFAALACGLVGSAAAAQACNGNSQLCGKTFDKVAFPTTHNSYAYGDNIAANQNVNIQAQLQAGIRGFMLDLHYLDSTNTSVPYLCHTLCLLLNDGPFATELQNIRTFMDNNANEVVAIFIENDGPFTAAQISQAFVQAGLDKYAYTPKAGAWPTLQTMIAQNKRLMVFTDAGADASVPWLAYDKDYVVQTPYSVAVGSSFGCSPLTTVRPLWVMNHFVYKNFSFAGSTVDVPASDSAATVNTRQSIVAQANACGAAGVFPNFITVDFFDVGALFQAVADINNVTYSSPATPQTAAATSAATLTSAAAPRALLRHAAPMAVLAAGALLGALA